MKKIYKAFTLVEMLIVMGIIIILMAVGIASGRFAIRRANRIEHENAAEQIYQAMQSYYTDNREYPAIEDPVVDVETLVTIALDEYIDDFDGGSDASYYYDVDPTGQVAVICVSLGGKGDENQLGIFCTGNGVGSVGDLTTDVGMREIEYSESGLYVTLDGYMDAGTRSSDWSAGTGWE